MKLTKCSNGHFYDAEKFQSCPHCSGGSGSGLGDNDKTDCIFPGSDDPITDPGMGMSDMDVTMPGNGFAPSSFNNGPSSFGGMTDSTVGFGGWSAPTPAPAPAPVSVDMPSFSSSTSDDDDGKTVAYWGDKFGSATPTPAPQQAPVSNVTVPFAAQPTKSTQPVVGWLVCVEGNNFGQSYPLYCGRNFIGRSKEMDVCLDDKTVSRVKHAIIIYEPKARLFFAQPGDSHELFYLNDNVVLSGVQLKDRDVITIGKSNMVFVPFCDERFGWEQERAD